MLDNRRCLSSRIIILLSFLFITCFLIGLPSCQTRQESGLLDVAETLLDEHPDSAYHLLVSLDPQQLSSNSELQARYALMLTKAQYKLYVTPPSDSLISLAANYYELHGSDQEKFYAYLYQGIVRYLLHDDYGSSVSMFRAMANGEEVDDHYAKGQMYIHLSFLNSVYNCQDEEKYALMAADEYKEGTLQAYYLNALTKVVEARFRGHQIDSSRSLLDSILPIAQADNDIFSMQGLLKLKVSLLLREGDMHRAASTYDSLRHVYSVVMNSVDYCNLAIIHSEQGVDVVKSYLDSARYFLQSRNDTIHYWSSSLLAYHNTHNSEIINQIQDSLISYLEQLICRFQVHNSISAQKDYSDWKLQSAEAHIQKSYIIISLFICAFIISFVTFFESQKRKKMKIESQANQIKVMQMELSINKNERYNSLQKIRNHPFVCDLLLANAHLYGLSVSEWSTISELFHTNLPSFENALRQLVTISSFELQVCFLLKLGFPPSQIAILTSHSASSISETRSRLYAKAFGKKGKAADWDAFLDTI